MSRAFEPKPDNIAVAQLVHLHADLGGKLLACQAQADRLAFDMMHVEAVKRYLKAELKRADVGYRELAERLRKHGLDRSLRPDR
jgi:hypothetical protein